MEIIARWRGGLHSDRLVDQLGQERFSILHSLGMTPRGLAGSSYVSPAIQHLGVELEQQTRVLLLSDAFLVAAGLTVFLMLVLLVIPVRTYPPRIQLVAKGVAHG
jgi:DHA2 family multidrug resistance protein